VSDRPPLRIARFTLRERYGLPQRPAAAPPAVQDAHRQTRFLLSSDLSLFERAMNLQLAIVAASTKKRSPETAALIGFWSRTFSYLSDACALMSLASYGSCPPLLRAACDCIAAQRSLLADGFGEYQEWLADALGKDREHTAFRIDLGRYRAASVLAQDERLGSAYRLFTDLTMPHFGSTVLLTGPDSGGQKLALAFADSTFHLGWAELIAGWLLALVDAQTETALGTEELGGNDELREEAARLRRESEEALANPRRCRVEELPDGRRLIHNFRRAVRAAPKRVIL
jgi:hypothetical protein